MIKDKINKSSKCYSYLFYTTYFNYKINKYTCRIMTYDFAGQIDAFKV